jgi:4-hydroxybenzoate polyprenyltransferase
MQTFLQKYRSLLMVTRAKDWRFSFIPQIFGNLYLWLLLFDINFSLSALLLLVLSLVTSFGFAALGYYTNEYFDQEDDAKAGKINKLKFITLQQKIILLITILFATFIPWIVLPSNSISLILMAIQILLFVLYAAPPFRLKRNIYFSAITDALYAYIIPLLLSYYTYYLFSGASSINIVFLVCYGSLLFIAGFRNIIIHYINDIFKDKKVGLVTLPRAIGVYKTNTLIITLLILEFCLILTKIFIVTFDNIYLSILLIPLVFLTYRAIKQSQTQTDNIIVNKPLRHSTDLYYQVYAPALILGVLVLQQFIWIILVPVHIALFVPLFRLHPIISWFQRINFRYYYIWVKQILSWIINYSIFFIFMLIGVNLKKRKLSALGYIKQKLNLK